MLPSCVVENMQAQADVAAASLKTWLDVSAHVITLATHQTYYFSSELLKSIFKHDVSEKFKAFILVCFIAFTD